MFHPWIHEEIARRRHQDLLTAAERYRVGRIVPDRNPHRPTAPHWLQFYSVACSLSRSPGVRRVLTWWRMA